MPNHNILTFYFYEWVNSILLRLNNIIIYKVIVIIYYTQLIFYAFNISNIFNQIYYFRKFNKIFK